MFQRALQTTDTTFFQKLTQWFKAVPAQQSATSVLGQMDVVRLHVTSLCRIAVLLALEARNVSVPADVCRRLESEACPFGIRR